MGKQKTQIRDDSSQKDKDVAFPNVGGMKSPRTLAEPEILLDDQIVVFHNTLTSKECEDLIGLFNSNSITMQPSPIARKGEAERTNERFSTISPKFAKQLYEQTGIKKAVENWKSMFENSNLKPVGLLSNIRIYKYSPGNHFKCHYDDHSVDPFFGSNFGKSEWTLLIYLSGEPEVKGGQTVFYKDHIRPKNGPENEKAVIAPLIKGSALFHRHGKVCMLHEALPPISGIKWVLRSDLVFGNGD